MKKMACVLLSLLLAFSAANAALAASVSYQDGKVTVNQEEGLYQVVIDGVETGKFVGTMPMDKGAYWKWRLIYTGALGAAAWVVLYLISNFL